MSPRRVRPKHLTDHRPALWSLVENPNLGIRQTCQQGFGQRKSFELRIVIELGPTPSRRFDNYMDFAVIAEGWKFQKIGHCFHSDRMTLKSEPFQLESVAR